MRVEIPNVNAWRWRAQRFATPEIRDDPLSSGPTPRHRINNTALAVSRFFDRMAADKELINSGYEAGGTVVLNSFDPEEIRTKKGEHTPPRLPILLELLRPNLSLEVVSSVVNTAGSVQIEDVEALIETVRTTPFGNLHEVGIGRDDRIYRTRVQNQPEYVSAFELIMQATADGSLYKAFPGNLETRAAPRPATLTPKTLPGLIGANASVQSAEEDAQNAWGYGRHLRSLPFDELVRSAAILTTIAQIDFPSVSPEAQPLLSFNR